MKAIVAAMLFSASQLSPPPLVPASTLWDEPVEQVLPLYTRWWFWVFLGSATAQTAAAVAVIVLTMMPPLATPSTRW